MGQIKGPSLELVGILFFLGAQSEIAPKIGELCFTLSSACIIFAEHSLEDLQNNMFITRGSYTCTSSIIVCGTIAVHTS